MIKPAVITGLPGTTTLSLSQSADKDQDFSRHICLVDGKIMRGQVIIQE